MLKIVLLSVCVTIVIAHDEKSKIAGGTNVGQLIGKKVFNSGEFPFVAQIKLRKSEAEHLYHCSASIIDPDVLLTAAHCLDGRSPEDFIIYAGNVRKVHPKSITQKRYVQKFVIHENFTHTYSPLRDDIAIIFLTKPFKITKFVKSIKGPKANDYEVGSKVTAIGWGVDENGDKPEWLQRTNLFLILNNECQRFGPVSDSTWLVTDDMVCAIDQSNSATCAGDSGGPLVYKNRLIGTNSFSFTTPPDPVTGISRCDPFFPSGYVRLANYNKWIAAILLENPSIDTHKLS